MTKLTSRCAKPLSDGSKCHACRVYDALIEAEHVCEPAAVDKGFIDRDRVLGGLADAAANLVSDLDDDAAMSFLRYVYGLSREYRTDDQRDDALAHPVGNA